MRRVLISVALLLAGCASATRETRFETYRNLVIVPVFINDQGPFNMMLDTGTDPSAIDERVAAQLGLERGAAEAVAGSGTEERVAYATSLPRVRVETLDAGSIAASTTDLSAIGSALGVRLDGVLGYSFLEGRIVQIDFPARRVRFPRSLPRRGVSIPFRWEHDSILIDDAAVNGQRTTALFDTGFNGSFNVMPAALAPLGLEREFAAAKPKAAVGYAGRSTTRQGSVDSIRIGTLEASQPTVIFWEAGTGHDSTNYSFTVGNGFLMDYVVTISFPDRRIVLER